MHPSGARLAKFHVTFEGCDRLIRRCGETAGQNIRVLDALRCALRVEWHHGMGRVAQQDDPPDPPIPKLAIYRQIKERKVAPPACDL